MASNRGYKYFGAAKDLPGVRELFQQAAEDEPARKSRAELSKNVDADYYGYMDDDDGYLVPLEKAEEENSINKILKVSTTVCRGKRSAESFRNGKLEGRK